MAASRGSRPRRAARWLPVLLLIAGAAIQAAASTCVVEIHRTNPGSNVRYLNLNEVELLSSVTPAMKIAPLSFNISSTWPSYPASKCFSGQLTSSNFCATNSTDTDARMVVTFDCSAGAPQLIAVRISNRMDGGAAIQRRIDIFSLTVTDAAGNRQSTRFAQLGSGLPSYIFPIAALGGCTLQDPCAGKTCPNATDCQLSNTCVAGECVAVPKSNGTSCGSVQGATCQLGVCTDPCAGKTCPNATDCQLSNTCVAGECVAVPQANGTSCGSVQGATCQLGVCTDPLLVAAGGFHGCVRRPDTTVVCWGRNNEGQATPPPGLTGVAAISAGGLHSCSLLTNGSVVCWGSNSDGQATPPSGAFTAIATGDAHSCAIRADTRAPLCWGADGALVDDNEGGFIFEADGRVSGAPGGVVATSIAAGGLHSCASLQDGSVACWGSNSNGQTLGIPSGLADVTAVGANGYFSCARRSNATLACWGANNWGQSTPPPALAGRVAQFDLGSFHACSRADDGGVTCWGKSGEGQTTPPAGLVATSVNAGGFFSCAARRTTLHKIACWGTNDNGQVLGVPAEFK